MLEQLEKAEKEDVKFDQSVLGAPCRILETGVAGGVEMIREEYSRKTLTKPFSTVG
jgi:hypothetical protein